MAEIFQINRDLPEPDRIAQVADLIRSGEVVAIPTDTVYGLAANPFDPRAVERVFSIKGRPADAPLLLLVDSIEMASHCAARLPPIFHKVAARFWPGPLTIVVPASPKLPTAVTANTGTVGLRLPSEATPVALTRALGGPITATSANLSGQSDCRSAAEVLTAMGERLSLIVDGGPSGASRPSTVLSVVGDQPEIIREGAIGRSELERFLRESI